MSINKNKMKQTSLSYYACYEKKNPNNDQLNSSYCRHRFKSMSVLLF